MTCPPVQVEGFKKRYGSVVAVNGITFSVNQGEIYGLLGPNGAGKTSTLECLEGIREPDGGMVRIMGNDPARLGSRLASFIGVQLQVSGLPQTMTPGEAVSFFGAYHRAAIRKDILERFGLEQKASTPFAALSTGQKRRLALALAVMHRPPIVILDEPTAGLDVESREALHRIMGELRSAGTTIILATHDMAEAEKMADRIAILLRGSIVTEGTVREITAAGVGGTRISVRSESGSLLTQDVMFPGTTRSFCDAEYRIYFSDDAGRSVAEIISFLSNHGDQLIDLRVERPSLEDRFLRIVREEKGAVQ